MFVCHAKSDIESTSETVDRLENTLDFPESVLLTSSLPGYSSDTRSEDELRAMLASTTVVLALMTETSAEDPEFSFELGAAWALGIDIVPLLLAGTDTSHLPWPVRSSPSIRPAEAGEWDRLVEDLSLRLDVPRRVVAAEPEPMPEPVTQPGFEFMPEPVSGSSDVFVASVSSVSIAPVVNLSQSEASQSEPPPQNSDVYSRLPSCEMSLEAGRAVSDCLFNQAEISDFERELAEPLGQFVDAIGGTWSELRKLQDLELWLGATENLLDGLPPELQRVEEWYQLGFELATLHNLAGQLVLDGPDRSDAAEQQWRSALERFLTRAENARIGYEQLGRVLALLENLAGPRAERDLTNIGRSLTELRSYAAGADGIHTAA
jgi:hypothetical protein